MKKNSVKYLFNQLLKDKTYIHKQIRAGKDIDQSKLKVGKIADVKL